MNKKDNKNKTQSKKNVYFDDKYEEIDEYEYNDDEEYEDDNATLKRIIMIIIIIIIILLLITSCSSLFFGKIGNKWSGSSNYDINDEDKNWEKIYNKGLKFIKKEGTTYVGDKYRIEFLEYNIHSNTFKCTTSNANIATCIVKGNYVEVHPRKVGKVTISVIARINGKEYIGTHKLTVKEGRKEIKLASSNGIINLSEERTIRIPYTLKNIFGTVKAASSNSKVATAKIKDGAVVITGHRKGKATITVSVVYRGKTYSVTYDVTVINNKSDNTTSNTMNTNLCHILPNDKNEEKRKSSENSLQFIRPSVGTLSPSFSKNNQFYRIDLPYENDRITLDVTRVSTTSKLYYYLDGRRVYDSNISLHTGTNRFLIVVEAENGSQKWYTVDINRAEKDAEQPPEPPIKSSINTLASLATSTSTEANKLPVSGFNKENSGPYTVYVESDTKDIDIYYDLTDSKATLTYKVNGGESKGDKDGKFNVPLKDKKTNVEITVTAEDGKTKKTYNMVIEKKDDSDASTLDVLSIQGFGFDKKFDPNKTTYNTTVGYDTDKITMTAIPTSSKSKIKYKVNGKIIDDLQDKQLVDIELNEGHNEIEVIVINGSKKETYTVNVEKPVREIAINEIKKEFYIEKPISISYGVYEDNELTENYAVDDISLDIPGYKGEIKIDKGVVSLIPSVDDIGKDYTMTIEYLGKKDSLDFSIKMEDYYIKTNTDNYEFSYADGDNLKDVIINTNIFNGSLPSEDDIEIIANGIRLKNDKGYIDIVSSNPDVVSIDYDPQDNTSSIDFISFISEILGEGSATVTISGQVYGKDIASTDITIKTKKVYSVVIDANGGFFREPTTEHSFYKNKGDKINLSEFIAHKVDESGNCLYYELESYNTERDGSGVRYEKDSEVVVDGNIKLYAIYTEESKYIELQEKDLVMYLTDVDLFHNEEYYKMFKKDKIIYPGANGSHVMYIKNTSTSKVTINHINVKETTTCVDSGCINMGYIIKYTKYDADSKPASPLWSYYYGGNDTYEILNKDGTRDDDNSISDGIYKYGVENTLKTPISGSDPIELNSGEVVEISLLWKWVEVDDKLDTAIGSSLKDQMYEILVSVDYDRESKSCKISK